MTKFYSHFDLPGRDSTTALLVGAGMTAVYNPAAADLIVFNGGADIGTEIYGEVPVFGGIPHRKSARDRDEIELYKNFAAEKAFLGICRGAQLLNCLNGGSLWQHVNNHTASHIMLDLKTDEAIEITSTHHQMMRPNLRAGELIAMAHEATVRHAHNKIDHPNLVGGLNQPIEERMDTEIVWYPGTKTLCIQGHPEYVPGSRFAEYALNLIKEKLVA